MTYCCRLLPSGTTTHEEDFQQQSPPTGWARPAEIVKAVVFFAADDSGYMTGAELFVDGGFAQV